MLLILLCEALCDGVGDGLRRQSEFLHQCCRGAVRNKLVGPSELHDHGSAAKRANEFLDSRTESPFDVAVLDSGNQLDVRRMLRQASAHAQAQDSESGEEEQGV